MKKKKPRIKMPSDLIDGQGFHQQAVIYPAIVEAFIRIIGKHGVKLKKKPFSHHPYTKECATAQR